MDGDFHGLTTQVLSSGHLRLEYLAEAGPRIVRLFPDGSDENLLAELPDIAWESPYGTYYLRGGHRLWHSPESAARVSVPDNTGLQVESLPDGVLLTQPTEEATGIRKSMAIHLHSDRPAVTIDHRLKNEGVWPVELAPWAITQMPLGGVAVLPQPVDPVDEEGLLPNRSLVLWPYTHWQDPRLHFHDDYLLVEALSAEREPLASTQFPGWPEKKPMKLGYFNHHGWIGYFRAGTFFRKRFAPQPSQPYPDSHCNAELYVNDRFLELESLGPLQQLEPGASALHTEEWEVYTGVEQPAGIQSVQDALQKLNLA